jgi:hypothetical protein
LFTGAWVNCRHAAEIAERVSSGQEHCGCKQGPLLGRGRFGRRFVQHSGRFVEDKRRSAALGKKHGKPVFF